MKICPKCSTKYSEIWNICPTCSALLKKDGLLRKVFVRPSRTNTAPISIIERVIDEANIIFLYLDEKYRPIICNQAVEHIVGYTREEMLKGNWVDLLFKDYPARKEIFTAFMHSCRTSIKSRGYEGVVTKKDGTECVLSWKNACVIDASGSVSGVICTAQDVTEKKSSEDDVAACTDRLRNILASIRDYALVTTNLDGKITYYGMSSKELFGWQQDVSFKDIYKTIFQETDKYAIKNKIMGSVEKYKKFEKEIMLLRGNDSSFSAMLTVTPLLDTKGKISGYVYIARDITERKKMEAQALQAEKMAAIGQLAAGIAHEINNPLLIIMGRLDMLFEEEGRMDPEIKRTLNTIKNQANRMRTIVDRLLSYSRKKNPRMDTVDVNAVLKTISPLVAYHPEFKGIAWKEELAKSIPAIKGDFNQLQELFLNIGLNACQSMPEGGVITISSRDRKDGYIEVVIKDTGSGISKENMGKIFNPFFTTRDDGTGLGLAICHNIINTHGGRIEVDSVPENGSAFSVILPIGRKE